MNNILSKSYFDSKNILLLCFEKKIGHIIKYIESYLIEFKYPLYNTTNFCYYDYFFKLTDNIIDKIEKNENIDIKYYFLFDLNKEDESHRIYREDTISKYSKLYFLNINKNIIIEESKIKINDSVLLLTKIYLGNSDIFPNTIIHISKLSVYSIVSNLLLNYIY